MTFSPVSSSLPCLLGFVKVCRLEKEGFEVMGVSPVFGME